MGTSLTGRLGGQIALVTGAGRGFGRAIAIRVASEGAKVVLLSRSLTELKEVGAEIQRAGGESLAVTADLTEVAQVQRACQQARAMFGDPTLLISNAGVPGPFGPVWAVDVERWWQAEKLHIRAPLLLMRELMPAMITRRSGRVIVVSAMASRITLPCLSAYSVGKSALNKLVEMAAAEAAPHSVQVFAVEPGFVVTQMGEDTARDPDAQRYLPHMMEYLEQGRRRPEPLADLERTAERCVRLAAGDYDALSGRYMELGDPIDEWRRTAMEAKSRE